LENKVFDIVVPKSDRQSSNVSTDCGHYVR